LARWSTIAPCSVTSRRATEIERAVEALLQGIATDYPRLLEHSRRMSGDAKLHHLHV